MKKTILLLAFIISQFFCHGQWLFNNFENSFGMEVIIGDSSMDSIWQIGVPQKTIFNSSNSFPNAILTDTLNSYPSNASATFILEIDDEVLWGFPFIQVEWQQKLDVEIGVDGGIVEASYDDGVTWQNVLSDTVYRPFVVGRYQIDPLVNGEIGFTGVSDWSFVGLCWGTPIGMHPDDIQSIHLRFTFVSDSNDTNQEGWMIDDFEILGGIIGASTEGNISTEIEVYPNPSDGFINLKLPEVSYDNFILEISNHTGQTVYQENIRNRGFQNHQVLIEDFTSGIYFVSLRTGGKIYQQKLIKI